jgi:hypothetical protein
VTRTTQSEPATPLLTKEAWNRLRHNGKRVRDEVTSHWSEPLK